MNIFYVKIKEINLKLLILQKIYKLNTLLLILLLFTRFNR